MRVFKVCRDLKRLVREQSQGRIRKNIVASLRFEGPLQRAQCHNITPQQEMNREMAGSLNRLDVAEVRSSLQVVQFAERFGFAA